jgi:hypothetical protein
MQTNVIRAALLTTTALAVLTGCGSQKPADQAATTPAPAQAPQAHSTPPNAIAVSPGGVTTAVDVPAGATESEFGQACHAAKLWMDAQHSDPKNLVEPYLKLMQQPGTRDPGNFHTPWPELTAAQQAGVIMAATSASRGECG